MDTASLHDPVEPLYDARIRGVFFITTVAGTRVHMHGGCWVAPCASNPPRMMVAFPKEFEGAEIVEKGGTFALSLTSREQKAWHDEFFAGRHNIRDLGSDLFLRAPGGSPIPRDAVAYFDCKVHQTVDLGDFLLVIGDVQAAEELNPEFRNLSVNEMVAEADPRGVRDAQLPFKGFDFDTSTLEPAPVTAGGPPSAERFEEVYGHRQWGLFFTSVATDDRGHFHIGCWSMQTSHKPPRMAVAFSKNWESTEWVRNGDSFAMTLLSADQLEFVRQFGQGKQTPGDYPPETFLPRGDGLYVLRGGVSYFVCRPQMVRDVGDFLVVIAPVEEYEWLNKDAVNLQDTDLASLAESAGEPTTWVEPRKGFPLQFYPRNL